MKARRISDGSLEVEYLLFTAETKTNNNLKKDIRNMLTEQK